ncbi:hypothetical protein HELRODRAFT_180050 [Helobdella robusta]|uniref:Alpha-2-macroglobulin bait region domain-containing protein n=1 Tax=Helobdella robusta TaxID=6412 RepID=T1FFE4_HELRO|nr:hypothetical protein HELRODRAFT_180050 [Helobdella robusta]ESN94943.1 hypothetical protein HELRODRAFT_180050 [Helobdella robusta]
MASWGLVNFLVSFLVLFALGTASSMNYSIVGPKMLRPGSAYQFVVTTYGEKNISFVLHAAIQRNSEPFIVEKSFQLTTGWFSSLSSELRYLGQIPNVVPDGRYSFFVKASEGANFSHSHVVTINRKVHSIFIQTDKVLYKPGQEVLFRVIAITPDLKPYKEKINITIYDTAQNKIKKLVDQQSDHGVITSSLKLSDITPLGDWKIHAETLLANTEKNFQVAEYVLPKYEVKVELPSYFFYNENNPPMQQDLPVSVVAKYTYGQPVKGTASVDIKLHQHYWWSSESFPRITKLIQLVDGKGDFSLNVAELKTLLPASWTWATLAYRTFSFETNVTETETGITLSASSTIETKTKRFDLEFLSNSPENYKPGLPYQGYLMLKNSDGSPTLLKDIRNSDGTFKSVHIKSTNSYPYNFYVNDTRPPETEISFSIPLTENGHIVFSLQTLLETDLINLEASYFDEISNSTITAYKSVNKFKTRDNGGIQLSLKNDENVVKPSSVLQFQVKSIEEIKEFQFQVLAKGLILANRRIDAGLAKKEHTFSVQVTPDLAIKLAPEARFVVSYVTSTGELIADSMAVTVADYFANKVSLSFNKNQTEPGDESVYLNVKTKQNSFVSLLAVDQSVLLLRAGNDITQDMVKDELSSYLEVSYHGGRHPIPFARRKRSIGCWWPIWLGGSDTSSVIDKAGLFVMTNLHVYKPEPRYWYPRYYMPGLAGPPMAFQSSMAVQMDSLDSAMNRVEFSEASSPTSSPSVSVRKKFPETWIWSEVISNSNGDYQLKVKVPDTITSWVASGFSVNQDVGLGLSESPAKITVIKPFFVSLNLPYSIIRGEEFALQVTVFNYYGQELEADVKLLASNHFKVIKCETKESQSVDVTKKIKVRNNDGKSVYFWVVATALGQIPIEVSAHAGLAADAMKATLLVKPEGQTQSYSTSQFIQLSSNETLDTEFQVTLPARDVLVPGSVVIEVTVIGDIIGTALNNIDDLLQMPYGCGEQNLLNLVPDVYLLKYLTESDQLTEEFSQKAKGFINAAELLHICTFPVAVHKSANRFYQILS